MKSIHHKKMETSRFCNIFGAFAIYIIFPFTKSVSLSSCGECATCDGGAQRHVYLLNGIILSTIVEHHGTKLKRSFTVIRERLFYQLTTLSHIAISKLM